LSTDRKGAKILARTFFQQLRSSGYTPNQIIGIATELIDLVTCELRDGDKATEEVVPPSEPTAAKDFRQTA
jgi:hypothetical protein